MRCPKCGEHYPDDGEHLFCENDGTPLVPDAAYVPAATAAPTTGCTCGRNKDDGTGYCTGCGMQLIPPAVTGQIETPPALAPAPTLGAVTDRGVRHLTNQDAVALALAVVDGTPIPVIVVCDGVSSARHSEESSVAAARTACDLLARAIDANPAAAPPGDAPTTPDAFADTAPMTETAIATDADAESAVPLVTPAMLAVAEREAGIVAVAAADTAAVDDEAETRGLTPDATPFVTVAAMTDPVGAMREAVIAAHLAICDMDDAPSENPDLGPPGCTFVGAIVEPHVITIGWVGDSRAYWLADDASRLLTRDHSYMNELIDSGQITEEEAKAQHAHSHIITRCLGPLNGEGRTPPEPSVTQIPRPATGMLLVCSDGLWNYAPEGIHIAKLARAAGVDAEAQEIARHLAAYALAAGGHDNITVAVAILDAPAPIDTDTHS